MWNDDRPGAGRVRRGQTSPALLLLLAGILGALVVLIGLLAARRGDADAPLRAGGDDADRAAVADGQRVARGELPAAPEAPGPVGDPDRIRETLRAGTTYHVVLKAGFDARVEDRAWGVKAVVGLAYAAEMAVDREVESNDGRRVVELRHFVRSRNAKVLCDAADVTIDLGPPGVLVLGALDLVRPGASAAVVAAGPLVEAVLGRVARESARGGLTKAVAHVDGLSGKRVRIAYVDGVGVESVEPVGCTLTAAERDFVFGTALLSDCYLLPDLALRPGATWAVDGSQFGAFLDPTWRGTASGEVVLARGDDTREGGKRYAALEVRGGTVTVDASEVSTRRLASFSPAGRLRYCLSDGYVDRASLTGRFTVEAVSRDHLLFETSFRSHPRATVEYTCTAR